MRRIQIAIFFLGVALMAAPLSAQITSGGISGRVTDETGGIIPGVEILLTNVGTARTWGAVTGDTGAYKFVFLQPGDYSVRAELAGFQPVLRRDIVVRVNETVAVDITLSPSEIQEVVEVLGTPPALQTESGEIGDVVDHDTIVNLPLNGRNFIQLVELQPGAVSTHKLPGGGISFHSSIFGGNFSVHGAPAEGTVFLLDGIDMKDAVDTRVGFRMTVDAIQEFKFQAGNYSAAFGRASGGVINIASRAGVNDYHGSAWGFFRNDAFDARTFFAAEKEPFSQQNIGAAIGGPIVEDQTFFFVTYEAIRSAKEVTRAVSVPTDLHRRGDFSEGNPIFNPFELDPNTGQRMPFPNKIIPESMWHPVSVKAFQRLFPTANRPGIVSNLVDSSNQQVLSDQLNIRIDQRIGEEDTIFGRYTLVRYDRLWPFVFASLPNFTTVWKSPAQNAVLGHTHTFGANAVNDFRVGFNRHTQVLEDSEQEVAVNEELGIKGLSPRFLGNPNINISGLGGTGAIANAPNNRSDNQFAVRENFSYITGNHNISTGTSVDWYQMNGGHALFAHGLFTFNGIFTSQLTETGTQPGTGNPVADYMLGVPNRTSRCCTVNDGFRNFRKKDFGIYVNDDWKVSPDLTLNLGVRYELFQPPYEKHGRYAQPDYSRAPELVLAHSGEDIPRGVYKADKNNFAPRLGFAYRINDLTVLRGGYGLFYMSPNMVFSFFAAMSPPYVSPETFISDTRTPQLSFSAPFPGMGLPSLNFYSNDPGWTDPYNQVWNLTLQRQIGNTAISASYIGNKGTNLLTVFNTNSPLRPGPGSVASRRIIPSIVNDTRTDNQGRSAYHGLELRAEQRFSGGLGFLASYVWSRCMDTGSVQVNGDGSPRGTRDPRNFDEDWGPCQYDVPHRLAANWIYQLPFGKGMGGLGGLLLRNWRIQGIVTLEGGQPFHIGLPYDNSNTGLGTDVPDRVSSQDPNAGPKTVQQFFNIKAFQNPVPFTYGNLGRNVTRGPGFANVDFGLHRRFPITEDHVLEFRGEVFNALNRANFLQPANTFGTPAFGVIGGAFEAREIQFSLKFTF